MQTSNEQLFRISTLKSGCLFRWLCGLGKNTVMEREGSLEERWDMGRCTIPGPNRCPVCPWASQCMCASVSHLDSRNEPIFFCLLFI